MKNFEKFLQYSRKLEELQTARKAKEVDEIQKLDIQMEYHKCLELDQVLESDRACNDHLNQELEEPIATEQEWLEDKTQELLEIEEFERQAQDIQFNVSGNDFEIIAEIQAATFEEPPYELKQLPTASADAFDHELSNLTEVELQREIKQNEAAINEEQESIEGEKSPGDVFFFRSEKSDSK